MDRPNPYQTEIEKYYSKQATRDDIEVLNQKEVRSIFLTSSKSKIEHVYDQ